MLAFLHMFRITAKADYERVVGSDLGLKARIPCTNKANKMPLMH